MTTSSTTSLVSTASSSSGFKPPIHPHRPPPTQAPNHTRLLHRCSCSSAPPLSFRNLRLFTRSREHSLHKRERALADLEQDLCTREDRLWKREAGLKAAFQEMARGKARRACAAAAATATGTKKKGEGEKDGRERTGWGWKGWRAGGEWKGKGWGKEKGWNRWEEGRFGAVAL